MNKELTIGFIGAGKVGITLGKYFSSKGLAISGYYSRNSHSAYDAAIFTQSTVYPSIEVVTGQSDLLFLTVPDGEIASIWKKIKMLPIAHKTICHCSGVLSSEVFTDIVGCGAYGYSIHPLCAIHDPWNSYKRMKQVYFTIEGCNEYLAPLGHLLDTIENPYEWISAEMKVKYHAASVFLSNHVIALAKTGADLLEDCGLSRFFSENAWKSMFISNAINICESGIEQSLTGPVERNDCITVLKHLACLDIEKQKLYIGLSDILIKIAKSKHSERDYEQMKKELAYAEYRCNHSEEKAKL